MSPIQTAILTPLGLEPTPFSASSLKEAQNLEPDGVYTVARTFQRDKALLLDAHLDRLVESARLENIPFQLDRGKLRQSLRQLIAENDYPDSRFRITVPRHDPQKLYLALEPLNPVPAEVREKGVKVATNTLQRQNPIAKNTAWMQQREQAFAHLAQDIYEVILVNDDGGLLEGSGSNFYGVLTGELRTANEGILNGISRKALLQCVGDLLPINLTPIRLDDLTNLDEAFLTSSSRGVVPIVEIDDIQIGGVIKGQVGHFTRELMGRYDHWTNQHIEPI